MTLTGPVLVLLEHSPEGAVRPAVLELLTIARGLGTVQGVWAGDVPVDAELDRLGSFGVATVHQVDVAGADRRLSPVVAEVLVAVAAETGASAVLVTSSFENKEAVARLGVATGAGVVVDASGVEVVDGRLVATKTVLAGTWTTRCAIRTALGVVALKANAVRAEPVADGGSRPVVSAHVVGVSDSARRLTVLERTERTPSDRPSLGEAQIVVVGGRGTEGDFAPVEELADALGGAVGATRVATDEGWIGHDAQIGQTGVTIAPRLYIGAGVSGAVHHRGGMQASGTIVAVNADPEAPIFEIADFGVVGDLFTVLPQASAEIRRLKEQAGA
ncbi:MAG: electron transfer flavoprotein subunit alpha/FixB family protein [Actinotalea sp.]|nr:electron transfer flavoprotein subunit alpha/FixB family protein [Actinotalea sp.]